MKTIYSGIKNSDLRFESLEVGDMFIIKPVAGVPDPEDALIYLKIGAGTGRDNAVVITNGDLYGLNNSVPVIKIEGELNWKMCN